MNLNKLILRGNGIKHYSFAVPTVNLVQVCGFKHFPPPPCYDDVEFPDPEKRKLKFIDKAPLYPPYVKPPKMQKKLKLMRGYEDVHNTLLHKQYGIVALSGGRMKYAHFEVLRLGLGRVMDLDRMFAIWRVDSPWQPMTKKGQGMRMGGGKGAIDHYVTPVKPGRIIIELGGKCEFEEIEDFLSKLAAKMPFKAMAISQKIMDETKAREKWEEENNQNIYTMKYLIQNNMGGCWKWLTPVDLTHFGKYM